MAKRMLLYSQDWAGRTCDSKKKKSPWQKPSAFLWFHHIYAYFISILRDVFTLDGCPHIETRKLMPTRTRTPSFASGATERQEMCGSLTALRGATKQRWRHPPGDPNFAGRFGFWMHTFFYSLRNHQNHPTWFVAIYLGDFSWLMIYLQVLKNTQNQTPEISMSWKEENGFQSCQWSSTAIRSALTMICAEETSHGNGAQRIAWKDCNVPMAYWNFASANCSNGDVCGVQLVFEKVRSPNLVLACFRGNHSILMLVCWSRMQLLDLFCYTFVEMWLRKRQLWYAICSNFVYFAKITEIQT